MNFIKMLKDVRELNRSNYFINLEGKHEEANNMRNEFLQRLSVIQTQQIIYYAQTYIKFTADKENPFKEILRTEWLKDTKSWDSILEKYMSVLIEQSQN